jgi:hypothetical protein
MAAKKKKNPIPPFNRAIKMVVCNKEKVDGKYRYMIAGLLVCKDPLPNIPIDEQGALVLEAVDSPQEYFYFQKVLHIMQALAALPVRPVKEGQGRSADQFLLSLQYI